MKLLALLFVLLQLKNLSIYALVKNCGEHHHLKEGHPESIKWPLHPDHYPKDSSCSFQFTAPLDYSINLECQINIPSDNKCTTQKLYVDLDGDDKLRDAEYFCGSKSIKLTSTFRKLALAYKSKGNPRGTFNCTLKVQRQTCECGKAKANEFPSNAALKDLTTQKQSFCGASIVSHYHLITAARCVLKVNPRNIVAIVGTNDLANTKSKYYAQYNIQNINVHEEYQGQPHFKHDIAVLKTTREIDWSRGVGPICLPPPTNADSFTDKTVNVIGWGTSSKLINTEFRIATNAECQKKNQNSNKVINQCQICTYDFNGQGRDSCQIEAGGPVILRLARQYLVGIISFAKNCVNGANPMGINTRITEYTKWILPKIDSSNYPVQKIS